MVDDPYARRRLVAGIALLIFFLIAMIGEAMTDRIVRFWFGVILCSLVGFVVAVWLLVDVAFASGAVG